MSPDSSGLLTSNIPQSSTSQLEVGPRYRIGNVEALAIFGYVKIACARKVDDC